MNHPTDARAVRRDTASGALSPGVQVNREILSGDMGVAECASGDILHDVRLLADVLNRDPRFLANATQSPKTTLVLSATDTGREILITLSERGLRVGLWAGEPFDVKIEATEKVHWAVLSGEMDADAAFFMRKVRIRGSIVTAFRVKNRFLGLLQRCFAQNVQDFGKFAATR